MQLNRTLLRLAVLAAALAPMAAYAVIFSGNMTFTQDLNVTGALSKGSGSFVIDHPLDPKNKLLYHSFVESPDVKNLYDGIATLDKNGVGAHCLPSNTGEASVSLRKSAKSHIAVQGGTLFRTLAW